MSYINIVIITAVFGLIPFLLEILVIIFQYFIRRVQKYYIQRPGQRTNLSRKEVERRKKIEEKRIKKSRGLQSQNMGNSGSGLNNEIEDIREQRMRNGRDQDQPDVSIGDGRINQDRNDDLQRPIREENSFEQDESKDGYDRNFDRDLRNPRTLGEGRNESEDSYARPGDSLNRDSLGYRGYNSPEEEEYGGRNRREPMSRSRGEPLSRSRGDPLSRSRGEPLGRSHGDGFRRPRDDQVSRSHGVALDEEEDY